MYVENHVVINTRGGAEKTSPATKKMKPGDNVLATPRLGVSYMAVVVSVDTERGTVAVRPVDTGQQQESGNVVGLPCSAVQSPVVDCDFFLAFNPTPPFLVKTWSLSWQESGKIRAAYDSASEKEFRGRMRLTPVPPPAPAVKRQGRTTSFDSGKRVAQSPCCRSAHGEACLLCRLCTWSKRIQKYGVTDTAVVSGRSCCCCCCVGRS